MKNTERRTKKNVRGLTAIIVWLLTAVFLAITLGASGADGIQARAYGSDGYYDAQYGFSIVGYDVEMDIHQNRTIDVKEVITVSFFGFDSHGIIRDFAVGGGVTYKDIEATCDSDDFSPYFDTDDSSFLSYYLRGDGRVTGETRVYTLTYTMSVPKQSDAGSMPLNVIGYGWNSYGGIQNVSATLFLPENADCAYKIYIEDDEEDTKYVTARKEDNVLYLTADWLPVIETDDYGYSLACGITVSLQFENGFLTSAIDPALLAAFLVAAALLALGVVLVFVFTHHPPITTTVNLTAPENMDPLRMGKIIDNRVDDEDIGAIVFWFADQGYLTIDMTKSEKNPTLRRTEKILPADAPAYQRLMLEGLFRKGSETTVSALENTFYRTAEQVKMSVPTVPEGIYAPGGIARAAVFLLLSLLALGGTPFLAGALILRGYFFWGAFVTTAIALALGMGGSVLAFEREYKWKSGTKWLVRLGLAALGALVGLTSFLFPSAAFSEWVTVLTTVAAAIAGILAGGCLTRTKGYADALGQAVGFKNFIIYAEKDKIRFMLQENPSLYYHILPYAQVLGVTDEWTDKFKGLALAPPSYARYNGDFAFDCLVWHSTFRALNHGMSAKMVSRPASKGNAGGIGGGGFGGFGGGGFGGGGGRGC